ncbi:hypothetical protein AVEN_74896-1, partial [Araneus ventricosus]
EEEHLLPHPYQTDCIDYNAEWRRRNKTGPRSQEVCQDLCEWSFFGSDNTFISQRMTMMEYSMKENPSPCFSVPQPSFGIYYRRNLTSQTAGGRIPTQDAYAIATPVGTVLRSLSTSFDLPIRCFFRVLQHPTNPRAIGTEYVRSRALRFFDGFGSPWKDGSNYLPLCREGAALVRDGFL